MRILNIIFKNINSLEGEGRIDFDRGPIAESGVFAITGPNGSGKTSILDVITLGLYGETFRFSKPADHIITKHTDESFAQVEFVFGHEKYRSFWQVKRSDATQPEMRLQRLSGDPLVIADTPHQVRQFVAELTGMDFHKFSKSIILPQGDFAAFLNALDSERLDILEKISGPDIYDDYRHQVETKHGEIEEKVRMLSHEIGLVPLLDDKDIQAAEHDLQDFTEYCEELLGEQALLQQQLANLQNISALETRHRQLETGQFELHEEIARDQQNLQWIADTPQAEYFRDDMRNLESVREESELARTTLTHLHQELANLQHQLATQGKHFDQDALLGSKDLNQQIKLTDSLKLNISEIKLEIPRLNELIQSATLQIKAKNDAVTDVESWLQQFQNDAGLLNDFPEIIRLRNIRNELQTLGADLKIRNGATKKGMDDLTKNKSAQTTTTQRIEELKKRLSDDRQALAEISQGKDIEELKELQSDQQNRFGDMQKLVELANLNAKLTKTKGMFGWFSRNPAEEIPDAAVLQTQVDGLKLEMSKELNIIKALEQSIANEALLKRFAEYRSRLVEGKPCFLCGATHHPYTLKPPMFDNAKQALADQRGRIQLLKTTLADAEKQLVAAQKQNTHQSAKQKFLLEKHSEWVSLANKLNVARDGLEITQISVQEKMLLHEADELEKIKTVVAEYTRLERNIGKSNHELQDRQNQLVKLQAAGELLSSQQAEISPDLEKSVQHYANLIEEQKNLSAHLEKQLKALNEKLPGKGKEDALFDKLNTRRQDYQIHLLRRDGLREELTNIQEQLQNYHTAVADFQQKLEQNTGTLDREEWLCMHLAIIEKQKLISSQEHKLKEQENTLQSLRAAIVEKMGQHGLTDFDQLVKLLKLIEQQDDIRLKIEETTDKLTALTGEITNLEEQIRQESASRDPQLTATDLENQRLQLSEKRDIAEQEIATLQNKLDKQRQYRQRFQTLDSELAQYGKLLAESTLELNVVRDEQGGLRRRVQQLLIEKLLSKANSILEKINGRYYIRSAASDHGLALEIEDTKQKNARRLPKSLSGGESFVVSLALALALAEIANSGKAIDSLFLDEGFGNLDAEALYLAMSTLENLKFQGKTVGVISHLDAVKKRIKTQIELVKKANGLSELKMVA